MKTLIPLVFLCASSFLNVQDQQLVEAGVTYHLNGPVRSLRTETANLNEKDGQSIEGPRILKMTGEFNLDSNLTDYGMYDDKSGLLLRVVTKFNGQTRESVTYERAGKVWSRGTTEYDSLGRVIGSRSENGDHSLQSK